MFGFGFSTVASLGLTFPPSCRRWRAGRALSILCIAVTGSVVDDDQPVGCLVVRDPGLAPVAQVGELRRVRRVGRDGEDAADLAEHRIREPDHGDLGDRRVLGQHRLHLGGVHVVPAADVHLLEPADDAQVAVLVDRAEVAGVQPAVGVDDGRGELGVAPVAAHHRGGPADDLADLTGGDAGRRSRVDDAQLDLGHGAARPSSRRPRRGRRSTVLVVTPASVLV